MKDLFTDYSLYRPWKTLLAFTSLVIAFIFTPGSEIQDIAKVAVSTVLSGAAGWTAGHFIYRFYLGYES